MDPDKNSFRSRGRIAQVLAQARASLKEPSRPYTPASLDNRSSSLDRDQHSSSQDHLNFDQGFGSSFYSKENNPLKQGSSTSQTSQSLQSDGAKDKYIDAKASIKIDPNMMMSAAASAGLGIFGSSTLVKSNLLAKEKEKNNIVSSIVNDISECVQGLETELANLKKINSNSSSSSSSSSSNLENAGKICESVFVNCDKLCKQIKESDSLSTSALKEIVSISRSISAIVTAVIKHAESSDPESRVWYEMKHRSICGVAKLALLLIQKDNLLSSTVNLAIYKECCYSLYQAMKFINDIKSIDDVIISGGGAVSCKSTSNRSSSSGSSSNSNSNNIGSSSSGSIGGSVYEDLDEVSPEFLKASSSNQSRATSVKSNSSHSLSGLTKSELEEFKISIESRSVDVILMLLQLFQNKFTTEFTKEIDVERRSMKKENSYPQNDDSKPEQQSTEDGLICFKVILEATIIASAYIRNLSNHDSVRKRLVRYGVVNDGICPSVRALVSGVQSAFQAFENSAYSSGKAGTSSAIQSQSQAITADNQFKASSNILKLVSKVLIQLVASIRNFSLDQLGRNQILAAKGICHVCTVIRLFPHVPDLLLNCVRVTAKLSLLEPFRTQMNSKSVYIKYIVEVVIREAMQCEKIMEGSGGQDEKAADSDEEYGDNSWPEWYTWPILSRSAFTLGNLTTSNNNNRLLIAVECKCLKPLTMLLQACACTVAELSKRRTEKSMQKQRDSLDGFEGKDGDNEDDSEDREQDVLFVDADGIKSGGGGDDYDEELERKKGNIEEENDENFALGEEDQRDRHNNMDYDSAEHEILDATVKLLRLLANISIEPSVGQLLARRIEPFQMLVEMLASAIHYEEFLLNVVAASTNLTYYSCNFSSASSDSDPKMSSTLVSMAVQLSHCLFHENSELVLESARALGNLTRRPAVLVALQQHRVDLALVLLLGHQNMDVVVAAAGAIVNLTADAKCKISLMSMQSNPSYELVKVLKRSSLKNLTLSTLIAQSFHNLLALGTPEEVRSSFMSTLPSSVQDTFLELVDLVEDLMAESDQEYKNDQSYKAFVKVGRAILQLLE